MKNFGSKADLQNQKKIKFSHIVFDININNTLVTWFFYSFKLWRSLKTHLMRHTIFVSIAFIYCFRGIFYAILFHFFPFTNWIHITFVFYFSKYIISSSVLQYWFLIRESFVCFDGNRKFYGAVGVSKNFFILSFICISICH